MSFISGSLAVVVALIAAGPVGEPPGVARGIKNADRLTVDLTLKDAELAACAKTYAKGTDIEGLPCRLAILAAVNNKPIATNADVKARRDLIADALAVADYTSSLPPGDSPSPGRRRARFSAHGRACGIIFDGVSALEAVPVGVMAYGEARQVLAAGDYRKKGCECAQRTTALALGADASADEQTRAQGVLTTHQCFAGGAFEVADRKGPGTSFGAGSADTRSIADASSPAGRLIAMSRSRSVEMTRCTDKGMDNGKVTDDKKLSTCACNVVKRWSLPFKKDDPKVEANLPIVEGTLHLPVVVEGNVVTSCGPVAGSLVGR